MNPKCKKLHIICFLILLTTVNIYANEIITLAIGEWPPFTSEKSKKDKIAEIIVRESFKLENIDVKYTYFPWKRAYVSVLRGDFAGTFPWYKTENRKNTFILSKETIIKTKEVFFHLKHLDFNWNNFHDLKEYRIGGTLGYSHVEVLKKQGNLKVELVSREELNFKKLLKGRIDIFPSSMIVGYTMIEKLFPPDIASLFTHHSKSLFQNEMVLLISKEIEKGKELADKFDRGLKKLKKSGRYREIISGTYDTYSLRQ